MLETHGFPTLCYAFSGSSANVELDRQEDQDVGPATKNITFPTRADPRSIGLVLGGQGVILLFTIVTSAIFNLDPLNIPSLDFSLPSIAFGVGVGTVMAGLGAVFDRIPWDVSQKLLRDTKVYTLMLLGRKTSKLSALGLSFLMSSAAGITEELLFRGVLLTWLHSLLGLEASVAISSALFGLAHVASFGAGSVVESVLGALFGISFIASGWNIVVPILAHTVYDAWTLFFTWLEASNQLEVYLQTNKRLVDYQRAVRSRASGNNEAEYIDHVIAAVFKIIDSNEDGVIVEKEIFQAFKLLGLDWNPFPQSKGSSVTLADRAHLALQEMDTNRDGTVSHEEFAAGMRRAYNLASELSNNQNSLDNKPNT
eukprot:gene6516-7187_t